MKSSDLRIGNWYIENGEYKSIFSIDKDSINGSFYGDDSATYLDSVKPIPLTPEILEKAGFENKSRTTDYYFEGKYRAIIIGGTMKTLFPSIHGECGLEPYGEEIKYLHQLQNLYFALTGEEIEIEF